jgi:DNA-binding NarL/FixJ family response regulator
MAADLWMVDFGGEMSEARRGEVMGWLAGFDIATMTSTEAGERLRDGNAKLTRPCAVVGLLHSSEADRRAVLETAECLGAVVACVILDLSFDERLGGELLRGGVQDYLDLTRLDADELIRRIEYAVIRSEPRVPSIAGSVLTAIEWQRVNDVYHGLPRREREVLDLLIAMRDQKQIARELGTKYTTVRTQINNLREKFGVDSTQRLVVLMVHTLYQKLGYGQSQNSQNGQNDDCDCS